MAEILRAVDVEKTFDNGSIQTKVIKGLNFTVENGDFVSIMGPSGCGKSTLLYMLGGLDNPTKGEVLIKNKSYRKMSNKEKAQMRCNDIGFVFQFYNLVQNLSVKENILLPATLSKDKNKNLEDKFQEIISVMGLEGKESNKPRELSGGQQQRVAIARALIYDPDVILADEPIGNLDTKSGTAVMELLKQVNDRLNTTIVQVTHSPESAQYGNRIIKMVDGEIADDSRIK